MFTYRNWLCNSLVCCKQVPTVCLWNQLAQRWKSFFCAHILTHIQYKGRNPYSCHLFYSLVNWTCFSAKFAPWTRVGGFCVGVYKPSAAPRCTSVGVSVRLKYILHRILLGGGFTTTRVCLCACVQWQTDVLTRTCKSWQRSSAMTVCLPPASASSSVTPTGKFWTGAARCTVRIL